MHEYSLALSIVQSVDKWAREMGVNVRRVVVSVPSVAMLDLDILQEAYDMLKRESRLENSKLEVRVKSPTFKCRRCGYTFTDRETPLEEVRRKYGEEYPLHLIPELAPTFIRCPRCGSNDIEADLSIKVEEVETA